MEFPERPLESDCCNSGCTPCILDVYEERLKKYNEQLESEKAKTSTANCLSETAYSVFKLIEAEPHTAAAFLYKFEYVRPLRGSNFGDRIRHKPGQHFLLKIRDFTRAYTPIFTKGTTFTILVRLYEHGKMSKLLGAMRVGEESLWRGPYGHFEMRPHKHALFIAQGTGIAPIFSVIADMLHEEACETFIKLFFCCRRDVYLHDELHKLRSHWNFTYEVFLAEADGGFRPKYREIVHESKLDFGHITEFLKSKDNVQIVICGSEAFNSTMTDFLKQTGFDIHTF